MTWASETDAQFPTVPEGADVCVREKLGLLDRVGIGPEFTPPDDARRREIEPIQDEVRGRTAWAKYDAYPQFEEGVR